MKSELSTSTPLSQTQNRGELRFGCNIVLFFLMVFLKYITLPTEQEIPHIWKFLCYLLKDVVYFNSSFPVLLGSGAECIARGLHPSHLIHVHESGTVLGTCYLMPMWMSTTVPVLSSLTLGFWEISTWLPHYYLLENRRLRLVSRTVIKADQVLSMQHVYQHTTKQYLGCL